MVGWTRVLRALTALVVLAAATVGTAAAQVTPNRPSLVKEMPTVAAPDLVIDKVQTAQTIGSTWLVAQGFVTIRNAGSLPAVFHKGAVLVSGAAGDPRPSPSASIPGLPCPRRSAGTMPPRQRRPSARSRARISWSPR